MAPTKLGLVPGTKLTVEQALLGLVTKSANDAAAALGELMGGDEARFAQMMTLRARALGMNHTVFRNASGLPDPEQTSTARDMAILARHLILDFPGMYHYFSTPSFAFHGRIIANHDRMLVSYPGADGLKTGYTDASGLNLVTSAVRDNVRLIGVVFGASNGAERDRHMTALLDAGYERMDVPVEGWHQTTPLIARLPSLVTPAQAATTARARVLPASTRLRMVEPERPRSIGQSRWTVQVGSFSTQAAAHRAALAAYRMADAGDVRLEQTKHRGRSTWRAQISGLTRVEAEGLCSAQGRKAGHCTVLRPDASEVASR
jgi:D-alanyl-D-alanine carboxypeptidase